MGPFRGIRMAGVALLALAAGSFIGQAPVMKATGPGLVAPHNYQARSRRGGRWSGKDPNREDRWQRQRMLQERSHVLVAGRMRNLRKLSASVPSGYGGLSSRRGESAIGVNGIRGASGGNREPGGACVSHRARPLRRWGY